MPLEPGQANDLLYEHAGEWVAPLFPGLTHTARWDGAYVEVRFRDPTALLQLEFRRGFVEVAHVRAPDYLRLAGGIHVATPLRRLTVSDWVLCPAELATSPWIARLHSLCLSGGRLYETTARLLVARPDCTWRSLARLEVARAGDEVDRVLRENLPGVVVADPGVE